MRRLHCLASGALSCALLLSGCHKKVPVAALPPLPRPVMIGVPPPTHPSEPEAAMPLEEAPALTVLLPRQPVGRYRPSPVQQVVLSPAPPLPMELGQLTTGNAAPQRQQTEDLVRAQQRRLAAIPTATAALHSQQIEQARTFLMQAADAWRKSDMDGARTLATKAKVLLDELVQ